MKRFEIKDNIDIQNKEINKIIQDCFGKTTVETVKEDVTKYSIENPDKSVLEEVKIQINMNKEILKLDIEEKSIDELKENGLISEAEEAIQAKNTLLEKITGKTVSERKKEMRAKSLPDSSMIEKPEI